MKLFSSIKESVGQIAYKFIQRITDEVNKRFFKKEAKIQATARILLKRYLIAQPEVQDVMNGSLRFELGIIDATSRMLNIIDTLVNSVVVDFTPFTGGLTGIKGSIQIKSINVNYSDIINMPDGIVVTEKGEELPWLEWLLFAGRGIIIHDYRVQFGHFGRTGGAHMIEGNGWGIPGQYAGTDGDNFVTRAIEQMMPELREAINV